MINQTKSKYIEQMLTYDPGRIDESGINILRFSSQQ